MKSRAILSEHANRAGVGIELAHDAREKTTAQHFHVVRLMQERGHFVERDQFAIARGEQRRLARHAPREVLIEALKFIRHPIEALREMTEFVAGVDRKTGAE